MAGKTFPGIGDEPPLDPADAADSGASERDYYSGPTVVDDAKVEMGLQKLRSLDAPPGPQTGVTQAVVDGLGSEPFRAPVSAEATPVIPEISIDSGRETAMGHSVSGPGIGQQQTPQPFDDRHLRGTMFGHEVHLPDFEPPRRVAAPAPAVSRALAVVERGAPTNTEVAVFQPPPPRPPNGATLYGTGAPALRSSRFTNTPYNVEVPPLSASKKLLTRLATAAVGIAAVVGAAMIWVRTNSADDDQVVRPVPLNRPLLAQPPLVVPTPPVTPAPAAAVPAAPPPVVAAPPPVVAAPAPAAAAEPPPGVNPAPGQEAAAPRPVAARRAADDQTSGSAPARHSHTASAHKHAAKSADDGTADQTPAKPSRPGKRADDPDPDATMAPTIE